VGATEQKKKKKKKKKEYAIFKQVFVQCRITIWRPSELDMRQEINH
jgi:hypothetical protein